MDFPTDNRFYIYTIRLVESVPKHQKAQFMSGIISPALILLHTRRRFQALYNTMCDYNFGQLASELQQYKFKELPVTITNNPRFWNIFLSKILYKLIWSAYALEGVRSMLLHKTQQGHSQCRRALPVQSSEILANCYFQKHVYSRGTPRSQ